MIDVDKIKGKSVKFLGNTSQYFTEGSFYRIGVANGKLFTVDDEGDDHELDMWYLEKGFDVSQFIKNTSMVGKYVRYVVSESNYIRQNDVGIIVEVDSDGDYWVRWLNPLEDQSQSTRYAWCAGPSQVEFV